MQSRPSCHSCRIFLQSVLNFRYLQIGPLAALAPSILSLLVTHIIINYYNSLSHCYLHRYDTTKYYKNQKALVGACLFPRLALGCGGRFEALAAWADVRSTKWISIEQPAAPSGDEGNEQHLIEAGHGTDSIVILWQFARCCHFCRCVDTLSKLTVPCRVWPFLPYVPCGFTMAIASAGVLGVLKCSQTSSLSPWGVSKLVPIVSFCTSFVDQIKIEGDILIYI